MFLKHYFSSKTEKTLGIYDRPTNRPTNQQTDMRVQRRDIERSGQLGSHFGGGGLWGVGY